VTVSANRPVAQSMKQSRRIRGWRAFGMGIVAAFVAVSCSSVPPTHPVEGKVVFKNKSGSVRRLAGGAVHFQSTTDSSQTAHGEIDNDGSFSLSSQHQGRGLPGVLPGQYKARIELPLDDDSGKPRRDVVHPKYLQFDKSPLSFTVPVAGNIEVVVEPPGR
jgi:hypothetical protein